jgi:hypothetical protein
VRHGCPIDDVIARTAQRPFPDTQRLVLSVWKTTRHRGSSVAIPSGLDPEAEGAYSAGTHFEWARMNRNAVGVPQTLFPKKAWKGNGREFWP